MRINQLVDAAHENAVKHGWWDGDPRTFGELIALCHSELSEALEEHREGHKPHVVYFKHTKLGYSITEEQYDEADDKSLWKPEGIPVELADVLIRIFDMAGHYGIDLESAVYQKMAYNMSRPYRHGDKVI